MEYRKFGNKYVLRLDKGEELIASLQSFCKENNIQLASVSGIGAVNRAKVGLFETATKQYHAEEFTGDMEIISLMGNVTQMDGEVYLHLHATLSDHTHKAFGGHLNLAVISATGEIVVDVIEGSVDREFSEEIGLNLLKF